MLAEQTLLFPPLSLSYGIYLNIASKFSNGTSVVNREVCTVLTCGLPEFLLDQVFWYLHIGHGKWCQICHMGENSMQLK